MLKNLSFRPRALLAGTVIVVSFLLFYFLPAWGTASAWLRSFLYQDYLIAVLLAACLVVAIRVFILDRRQRAVWVFILFPVLHEVVFRSRWLPAYAQPTYLFILTFFHLGALFLALGLDSTLDGMKRLYHHPGLGILRRPAGLFFLIPLLIFAFESLVVPSKAANWHNAIQGNLFLWVLLIPALGAWLRHRYAGRPAKYPQGLVISGIGYEVIQLAGLGSTGTILDLWFTALYVALWLHLYVEELWAALRRNAAPVWESRAARWIRERCRPVAERPQPPRKEPVKIPTAWIDILKARAQSWPGRLKNWRGQGISLAGKYQRYLQWTAYAIALIAIGVWVGPKIYQRFFVTVIEFTPAGLVGNRTVIRVTFSGNVRPLDGNITRINCFHIEPPLAGVYRQDAGKTIVFVPSEPLKPSTLYKVQFESSRLAAPPKRIQSSASTEFNTAYLAVTDAKLFYTYDLVTNEERQVTGEVNFNALVSLEELRRGLRVFKGKDQQIPVELEKSHVGTRFYFKTGNIQREKDQQILTLRLPKGLKPVAGNRGLESDYQKTLVLPEKVKLEVAELKLWHEPGNTLVSVLFNMPVSDTQLRGRLTLTPPAPFKIETEYCYAVLRGEFKPNVTYKLKIAKGLTSIPGEVLEHDYEGTVTVEDLPSKVEFAQHGNILALSGPKTIAIHTLNLDKVNVQIQKVFRNNLIQFLSNESSAPMSHDVYSGDYDITEGKINEELTQYINLEKFHKEPYKGLFSISVNDPRYSGRDSGWFLCTDLGLIAKHSGDDLIVYVLSVETLAPQAGATVQLYSDTNQVMDKQTADSSGKVVFVNWKKNEYKFRPEFLVAQKDDDFSFLYFDRTTLNQNQFAVGGDAYGRGGMDAFLAPERGVYRPGEKAFVTAVVRNGDNSVPAPIPLRLAVRDPRGAELQHIDQTANANGAMSFTIAFPPDALTGHYELQLLRLDKNQTIGTASLKVEEFIPDKLKVEVAVAKEEVQPGKPLVFKIKSRQMFGPPAAGSKVVTSVRFLAREFQHPNFKGFTFSDPARQFDEDSTELGEDKLDAQGEKAYEVAIPEASPPSALKAYIYTEVFDSGGRAVSAAGFADIHPYTHYLGVKLMNGQAIHIQEKVSLHFVDITPAGRLQTEDNVHLIVRRKAWYSIFRRSSWGRAGYQSSSYEELVVHQPMAIKGQKTYEFTPTQPGEYSITLVSPSGMRSGIHFDVLGLGYETTSLESPEKLKIIPDKEAYDLGDHARFLVQTPFAGKLVLTLEREKVYETRVIEVSGRETSVSFDVQARDLPNMYVVGMLLRTPDEARKTLPMVSFGIASMNVKTASKRIGLSWTVPKAVQSSSGLDAELQVAGDPAHTDVVLAAVDQGILQITSFATPDPLGHFYRKRGLTTQTYSIFDLVLPDLSAKKFAIGGDEGSRFSRRHLNPIAAKKKKSMALYSGLLHPDAQGRVRYHFETKGFNGEVRLMALAIQGDHFGSSDRSVEVADPLVLIPNYPRFIAPGDQFQIPVELYNKTGRKGLFTARLRVKGPLKVTGEPVKKVELGPQDQKRLLFFAEAQSDAGIATLRIQADGAGAHSESEDELSVRPYNALSTQVREGELKVGQSKEFDVPGGFIPFGQRIRLTVSNNPVVRYLRSLDYLIQYPYGCAEQITSKIFPLLYFKSLGFATGRFEDKANAVDLFVQDGIETLEKQQLADGRFSLWPGGEAAPPWVNYYIAHCLLEAKAMGYAVSPQVMQRLSALIGRATVVPQNQGRLDRRTHNTDTRTDMYLLYLKTLIGQPDQEAMSNLRQTELKNLGEADRDLLSLSYSRLGDRQSAEQILAPDFKSRFLYREQYGDFNSPIRNTALYLLALVQANPASPKIFEIVDYLTPRLNEGSFGNTQENSWTFMALAQVFKAFDTPIKIDLLSNGQPYKTVTGTENTLTDNSLSGKHLTLKNNGSQKAYYYLLAEGTPLAKREKPEFKGLVIKRSFLDRKGNPANLSNVMQGELLVVTLSLRPEKDAVHNVVLVDLLPAGFEVENPRLSSRGQLEYDPATGFTPSYQDIRDDRVLLFSDQLSGPQQFSYSIRAVTPGRFTVPNAYAEAMYDPAIHGESYEPRPVVVVDNNAQL